MIRIYISKNKSTLRSQTRKSFFNAMIKFKLKIICNGTILTLLWAVVSTLSVSAVRSKRKKKKNSYTNKSIHKSTAAYHIGIFFSLTTEKSIKNSIIVWKKAKLWWEGQELKSFRKNGMKNLVLEDLCNVKPIFIHAKSLYRTSCKKTNVIS